MRLIGQAHTLVHQNGVLRVQTDIRAGTRTDKKQHFSEKVTKVESILAADGKVAEQKFAVAEPKVETKDVEKNEEVKGGTKEPLSPATNKGTWASMLKK